MQTSRMPDGLLLVATVCLCVGASAAQQTPPDSRYPLRVHLLAIDDTHRIASMQPNWCSMSMPSFGGDASGAGADGCGGGGGFYTLGGDEDFAGGGRADLVTPPAGGTQGLSFTYEGCTRVRVPPGFQGLPARWKKPGKLEVLVPTDAMGGKDRESPPRRCTLTVNLQKFVYLRLPNGSMLSVSQEAFARKPALRVFLSGGTETLQPRVPPTVSVKQLLQTHP